MADTVLQVVVSPFLGALFDNLTSLIRKEAGLLWGTDKEMKKLANTLSSIRDVLGDAEEKQATDKVIGNWLLKLKNAAYDADDVLDEWATAAMQLESQLRQSTRTNQVFGPLLSFFQFETIKFRRRMSKKINKVLEKFDEIASEGSKFHLRERCVERRAEVVLNRETSSISSEPRIYGRDIEKEYFVGILLNEVSHQDMSIYSIVGIGGLGKTTVAQIVYNDDRVKTHFDLQIWVCVSDDFNLRRVTRAIIVSVTGDVCFLEELDHLQSCLQEKLLGKRFLLVLDDVWNENQDVWNKFRSSLSCGAKGSSVIVTTRLKTVASIVSTFPPCYMNFLSEDDCWSLFKQSAFGMGNEESPNLVQIGKAIVRKCGGVPLAAKFLGGLMRFKVGETEWLFIRDSEIWDLPERNENTILPALRLSYTHLSSDLKQCFAYCSIFPKDYRFRKEEVIHLWMANGLLQSNDRAQLENIGSEIFNALIWRSFFHDVEKDGEGNILSCMMHDLVHDLVRSINMSECFIVEGSRNINVPNTIRHVSVTSNSTRSSSVVQTIHQSSLSLRTLIISAQMGMNWPTKLNLPPYKSLRAMSLESLDITMLPDSLGNLKHLRYLNLANTKIVSLPDSICGLRNLQTLKLERCYFLQMLPKDTRHIISLRHLDIRKCNRLTQMPPGIGKLACLQTLSIFIVGKDSGQSIKELQELNQLGGELMLKGLEHVRSSRVAKEANLMRKQKVHSLSLAWSDSHSEEENDTDVAEGLQPHSHMKNLHIQGYGGQTLPRWLKSSFLPKLVKVSLSHCRKCEDIPLLGSLSLKVLSMSAMDSVKFFNSGGVVNGYPLLEELVFDDMPKLEELSLLEIEGIASFSFPSLKKLRLKKCPMLTKLRMPLSLESLFVQDCNEMVLQGLNSLPLLYSLLISGFNELLTCPKEMLQSLSALQTLSIWSCRKLKALPAELGNLSALTSLVVFDCKELISLPKELINLPSLKNITIDRCYELKSLPELGRSSLTSLSIIRCSSLTNLSRGLRSQAALQHLHIYQCPILEISKVEFQRLGALRSLIIGGFYELTSLPDGIQHLSMLQTLQVWVFPSLVSLPEWISVLTKLQYVAICFCKNLRVLPDELQDLTSLQILWIENCHPDLHRRCEKEKGEDWHKISHVPNVRISQHLEEKKENDCKDVRLSSLKSK